MNRRGKKNTKNEDQSIKYIMKKREADEMKGEGKEGRVQQQSVLKTATEKLEKNC